MDGSKEWCDGTCGVDLQIQIESLYRGGVGVHRIEALTRMAMVKSNAFSSSAISASYLLHNAFSLDLFEGRCQGMA